MLKIADLQAALADKKDLTEKLALATARVGELEASAATLAESIAALTGERDTLLADLGAAREIITGHVARIGELEANATTVSQATVERLHELGVPAGELPSNTPAASSDNADEALLEKYNSLTGAEKTTFLRANKAALLRASVR